MKALAYPRYPKQIMGDDKVLAMQWDAYGMHNWLLDISFQQDPPGTIPNDLSLIRRWLRSPSDDVWRQVWPQLSAAWPECGSLPEAFPDEIRRLGSSRRANPGMLRTVERQRVYSESRSKSARMRWVCENDAKPIREPCENTEDVKEVLKTSSKAKAKPQKPKKQEFTLPDWVPKEAWEGFEEMRQKLRKPMTTRAKNLALKDLEELCEQGYSAELVLNTAIKRSWLGLFPPKGDGNGNREKDLADAQRVVDRLASENDGKAKNFPELQTRGAERLIPGTLRKIGG